LVTIHNLILFGRSAVVPIVNLTQDFSAFSTNKADCMMKEVLSEGKVCGISTGKQNIKSDDD
jgi:hypothetical protein